MTRTARFIFWAVVIVAWIIAATFLMELLFPTAPWGHR